MKGNRRREPGRRNGVEGEGGRGRGAGDVGGER